MQTRTAELELEPTLTAELTAYSKLGTAFYNAALRQRLESGIPHTRFTQMKLLNELRAAAEIPDDYPKSVLLGLLAALDAAFYSKAKRATYRSAKRFWPLTWRGQDLAVMDQEVILQPDFRFSRLELLPVDSFGILCKVNIGQLWSIADESVFQFNLSWKLIPRAGPGRAISRAFGYEPCHLDPAALALSLSPDEFQDWLRRLT